MFGLTTVLLPMIGGLFGWIKSYMDKKLDAQIAERQALLERAGLEMKARADLANNPNTELQFTRRIIVIALTTMVIYMVIFAINNPDAVMTIVHVTDAGFWQVILPFFGGVAKVEYVDVPLTLIIGPMIDSYLAIVAFYVGSGGTQRWR